jgi:hypothetical protein
MQRQLWKCVSCTMQRQLPVSVLHSMSESMWQWNCVSADSGIKKVKLSLCLIKHMQWRCMGEWRYSSTILDLGTRWRWVVSFTTQPLCLWYLLGRILSGPHNYSLTHGAEPFLRSCQLCSYSRTSQHFMEPEGSLPWSQEPSTDPILNQSNPIHPILSL